MTEKAIIKSSDYDSYKFQLPVKSLLGSKRKSYIFSQLEKRHPMFCAKNCFDTKIVFAHKKMWALVTVMDNAVLASYKAKFPGKILRTQGGIGKKSTFVFAPTWLKILVLSCAMAVVVALCAMMASVNLHNKNVAKNAYESTYETGVSEYDTASVDLSVDAEIYSTSCVTTAEMIETVTTHGGAISSISWCDSGSGFASLIGFDESTQHNERALHNIDQMGEKTERMSAKIFGCYPEQFTGMENQVSLSTVVYDERIPTMTVDFWTVKNDKTAPIGGAVTPDSQFEVASDVAAHTVSNVSAGDMKATLVHTDSPAPAKVFTKELRAKLLQAPFTLMTEKHEPLELSFAFSPWRADSCVQFISELQKDFSLFVSSFYFVYAGDSWNGNITFYEQQPENVGMHNAENVLRQLITPMTRFAAIAAARKKAGENMETTEVEIQPVVEHRQKIGMTVQSDGTKKVYYKLPDGKIIMEEN